MRVHLAYGESGLTVEIPTSQSTVIEPEYLPGLQDESFALQAALQDPIQSRALGDLVKGAKSVAISICDHTRAMPSHRVLPVLLSELRHIPSSRIRILVATGTHRPSSPAELERMVGTAILESYPVLCHSAFDREQLVQVGTLEDETPILLNRDWVESDVRITVGFVEPHFFAGFSGGPKLVAPGLAGLDTILHLHSARMIGNPNSTWGLTVGNPIHDAVRRIAALREVTFGLDVTLNRDHAITRIFAGAPGAAHAEACEFARRTAMRPVGAPFDVVLTTNSGYPLDLNLYQTVKGMSAAARVVREGGAIVCASECRDGLPSEGEYRRLLTSVKNPEEILQLVHSPGFRRHDQWQVQVQAQIQRKARVYLKTEFLSEPEVRAAHLVPIDDVSATVYRLLEEFGPSARLCVLPEGPQTIPFIQA